MFSVLMVLIKQRSSFVSLPICMMHKHAMARKTTKTITLFHDSGFEYINVMEIQPVLSQQFRAVPKS